MTTLSTLTEPALRQLLSEAIAAESEIKRSINIQRERVAAAEREQFIQGKHLGCVGTLRDILQAELDKRPKL